MICVALLALLLAGCESDVEFSVPPASVATPTAPARYEACAADDSAVCMCCCVSTEGTHPTPIAYYHGEKWLPDELLKPRWPWLKQYNTQPNSTVACHSEGDNINVCYGPIQ